MKSIIVSVLFGMAFAVVGSSAERPVNRAEYREGEILVRVRAGANALFTEGFSSHANGIMPLMRVGHGDQILKLKLRDKADFDFTLAELKNNPAVVYAQPNYVYYPDDVVLPQANARIPNDGEFAKCWSMHNAGQAVAGSTGVLGADIHAAEAWARGFTGSRNVIVAVMDTGIDWDHPDLAANLYTNPREIAGNGIDDDGNGYVDDIHGWNFAAGTNDTHAGLDHGTHVSGIIGAVGNNGVGVSGVNWQVSILPVKIFDGYNAADDAALLKAFAYVRKSGAKVVNASWGGGSYSQALFDAISDLAKDDVLFVTSGGNNSSDNDSSPHYPSNFELPNIIAVAASTNQDKIAYFSNYGVKLVHVAAPGDEIYSTLPGGKYGPDSGTSMASPHVAGLAALIKSAHPDWNFSRIRERILSTCDPLPDFAGKVTCGGRVNADRALSGE